MRRLVRSLGTLLLLSMLFILTWVAVGRIVARLIPKPEPVRIVEDEITTAMFPVLVIYQEGSSPDVEARIVFEGGLDEFLATAGEHVFLVPERSLADINAQLAQQVLSPTNSYSGPGEVNILSSANGQQYLKVTGTWGSDHTYVGWYSATSKTYEPKQFLHDSAIGKWVDSMTTSLPVTIVLWAIGWGVYRRVRVR